MPGNNRKVLQNYELCRLETFYNFTYNRENQTIVTHLTTNSKTTEHSLNKPFKLNVRLLNNHLTFNKDVLEIWKDFQDHPNLSKYSLFRINNAYNALKIMYQNPTRDAIADMLKENFSGIKSL